MISRDNFLVLDLFMVLGHTISYRESSWFLFLGVRIIHHSFPGAVFEAVHFSPGRDKKPQVQT